MSVIVQEPQTEQVAQLIVNDFNINVATANGSGSQTSNNMLIRSLYKMGIPVTGKNLFPSNIQGLPTWFNIRLSKDGYLARRERVEIMICMNGATVAEDMESVVAGRHHPLRRHAARRQPPQGCQVLCRCRSRSWSKAANLPYNLQRYVANMVYVGVAAYLLEIEMDEIKAALSWNFGGKTKPIELNWSMVTGSL
jgi:2-oxoglutarate ferredoxin oxidoreductase subunit alpha